MRKKELSAAETFGGIDADADALLDEAFQAHDAYLSAVSHSRFVVLGRKGSGKTAIYRRIVESPTPTVFPLGHTFADYPWAHHQLQATVGVPEEQRYYHSWQYLILITTAKVLLNYDQSQPWNPDVVPSLNTLERFVVDSYGTKDPDVAQLFIPAKRLKIVPHLKVAKLVDVGVDLERLPVTELPRVVQEVNKNIAECVAACLTPGHDYFICFDELDRGFDPSNKQYIQMLIGLVLAAREINIRMRQAGKRFSVVVFLRDDIYELLRFEDKNKITENWVSRIAWDQPKSEWTLKSLMERRFTAALGGGQSCGWDEVFDETQEMPSRQKKYQHILDRTFRRPRDIIKFCNEVLQAFQHEGDATRQKFANMDVVNARDSYSDYFLRELDDEIHKHIPHYENYFEILKLVGALQFNADELKIACERRQDLMPAGVVALDILRDLFRFSVVAYQRSGGVGGGSEYVWAYLDPRARFDEAATNFKIHPGLMEALGLKKFRLSDKV